MTLQTHSASSIVPDSITQPTPAMTLRCLVLLFMLSAHPAANACSCIWQGPFNAVYPDADLVVVGTVTTSRGNSFDLVLDDILQGQDYRDTLRIWGKKDDLCRPDVDAFPPGSSWIMALKKIDALPEDGFDPFRPNISFGREEDYYLSSCGVNWLEVKGGRVSGNIIDGDRWQYLDAKKSPILIPLFQKWLAGELGDDRLKEAQKPQSKARELMNDTRIFLQQKHRQDGPLDLEELKKLAE